MGPAWAPLPQVLRARQQQALMLVPPHPGGGQERGMRWVRAASPGEGGWQAACLLPKLGAWPLAQLPLPWARQTRRAVLGPWNRI